MSNFDRLAMTDDLMREISDIKEMDDAALDSLCSYCHRMTSRYEQEFLKYRLLNKCANDEQMRRINVGRKIR